MMHTLLMLAAATVCCSVTPDRSDRLYKVGELATYTVTVTTPDGHPAREGKLTARLDNFGVKKLASAEWNLALTNVFTIAGKLDEPGFLRLSLEGCGLDHFARSVGYEPKRIVKGSPSPRDFDVFWAAARRRYAEEVDFDPQVTPVPERSTEAFDFYRLSFATYGRRVYGYLSVPKGGEGPFPLDFEVCAAGFGDWTNDMRGESNRIVAKMSVYPFEPDWRWRELNLREKYDALNAAMQARYGAAYSVAGLTESREAYFFYPVLLAFDREVDWLLEHYAVDRSRVWYHGTSQGGGFGFYLCGLNRAFTRAAFFVPAITDTMGSRAGRADGWPNVTHGGNRATTEKRAAVERNAPYFDGANFASRITCPVRVLVGFADLTCPACAVYASYNEIPVKDKAIVHGYDMPHTVDAKLMGPMLEWLFKN